MQPNLGSVYELVQWISRWVKNLQGQSPLLRTSGHWDRTEYCQCYQAACFLLSCNIDESLGNFTVTLSIIHGKDVIISRNPIFSLIFSLQIHWELMLLRFGVASVDFRLQELFWFSDDCIKSNFPLFL